VFLHGHRLERNLARASAEMITIPDRDWRLLAACRHLDPELFFPVSASGSSLDQITQAKAICAGCPVQPRCLAFALDTRQRHGVWGGMTELERRLWARKTCAGT
jgi:WhiB family redox-sensing transcriptional regulator